MTARDKKLRRGITTLTDGHRMLRIKQIILAVEFGLLSLLILNLSLGAAPTVPITISVAVLALLFILVLLQRGHLWPAYYSALVLLTGVCGFLVWSHGGIRDSALLGFPAILYFANIVGNRKMFYALLASVLCLLLVVGASEIMGWKEFPRGELYWNDVADVLVLMCIVGFSMKLFSDDLFIALASLSTENRKVKKAQRHAVHLSMHDGLTGLPNRVLGEEKFLQAFSRAQRQGRKVGVLFLDIDHFKAFNDSLGHNLGDQLIREVGHRLESAVRMSDTVCRYGGDEFIVILEDLPDRHWAENCAQKISSEILQPIHIGGRGHEVTVSIGIAIAPDDGNDYNGVCRKADMAMYRAKENGRNTVRYFYEDMNHESDQKMAMIGGLRQAIREREFTLQYQPQIDLRTGKVVGAEALIRWRRPGQSTIFPNDFIPVAEETRLIVDIGNWVIPAACEECARWHEAGFSDITVAVNVSPIQLGKGQVERSVREALRATGLRPEHLQLELTESILIDENHAVRDELLSLYKMGIFFAIDDFGTGYSNLEYLSRLETGCVKIDRSFVKNHGKAKQNFSILNAILTLAQSLELSTTVEGIEDAETLELVRSLGCDVGQGHYWAKSMEPDDFLNFLSLRNRKEKTPVRLSTSSTKNTL